MLCLNSMRAQLINKRPNYTNHKTSLSSRVIVFFEDGQDIVVTTIGSSTQTLNWSCSGYFCWSSNVKKPIDGQMQPHLDALLLHLSSLRIHFFVGRFVYTEYMCVCICVCVMCKHRLHLFHAVLYSRIVRSHCR